MDRLMRNLCLSGILASSACANLTPFLKDLRESQKLSPGELKKLQFFSRETLVIEREFNSNSREISASHQLISRQGTMIERVILATGTPGIVIDAPEDGNLFVSFEKDTFFVFAPYKWRQMEWVGTFEGWYCLSYKDGYKDGPPAYVKYSGNLYTIVSGNPCLMVGTDSFRASSQKTHRLPGMTLSPTN